MTLTGSRKGIYCYFKPFETVFKLLLNLLKLLNSDGLFCFRDFFLEFWFIKIIKIV